MEGAQREGRLLLFNHGVEHQAGWLDSQDGRQRLRPHEQLRENP